MKRLRVLLPLSTLSLALALAGCPGPVETVDSGVPGDAGDGGARDGGARDGGTSDGGTTDAPVAACGDGIVNGTDACDDGNTTASDGCSATCTEEAGWSCDGADPTVCTAVCGDGTVVGDEAGANGCDDANTTGGDGCSATCGVEPGFSCAGAPSVCNPGCGDGIVAGTEICDDGNLANADGCSAACVAEDGYTCTGAPSTCTSTCGDGSVAAGAEACDDGNTSDADGCSSACTAEAGYVCMGSPSTCATVCGDGMIAGAETCDDLNAAGADGCSASCTIEVGFVCAGVPSTCTTVCGDGIVGGVEACDDANTSDADGCSASCAVESGYSCTGAPSACSVVCGDGLIIGAETCDDANASLGDGCSATCAIEAGFICSGAPSVCGTLCGDGITAGAEFCDDGNAATETECPYGTATCTLCNGTCDAPLALTGRVCGDAVLDAEEACDDGYTQDGDGCTACAIDAGFTCTGTTSVCSTTIAYTGAPVFVPDSAAAVNAPINVSTTCRIAALSSTHRWEPNHTWASDLLIDLIAPSGASVRLSNHQGGSADLDGPYTFASAGATWPGAGSPIAAGTYAASYAGLIGTPANGTWNLRADDDASGDTGSIAEFSITITCDPGPNPGVRTCGEILAADPAATDGTYLIDPDGFGGVRGASVYCDMTNGGWTLLMATNSLGPVNQIATAPVLPGSGSYLPLAFARALASAGTQVHIRTAGEIATRSITSVANTLPILNLRLGAILNDNSPLRASSDDPSAIWTGPLATDASYLWHNGCGPAPFGLVRTYPDLYWSCNNGGGLHILGNDGSTWQASAPNEDLEVYVR